MQTVSYDTPLCDAIRECHSLPELVKLFQGTHPAFLAAIVRTYTQLSPKR